MNLDPDLRATFRRLAEDTSGVDLAVYRDAGRDPLEPIVGHGDPHARVGFFGRDPGRDEVQHQEPFIGAGGQHVRRALYRRLHDGAALPDFETSKAIGRPFFWANTVPYKPVGNKAWSMAVKKRFHEPMRALLLRGWHGREIITLGREAFLWFGIGDREAGDALEAFWAREDRFEASVETPLALGDGTQRTFRLHPLPHPSPLNATWYRRFPGLLDARLAQLDVREGRLRI